MLSWEEYFSRVRIPDELHFVPLTQLKLFSYQLKEEDHNPIQGTLILYRKTKWSSIGIRTREKNALNIGYYAIDFSLKSNSKASILSTIQMHSTRSCFQKCTHSDLDFVLALNNRWMSHVSLIAVHRFHTTVPIDFSINSNNYTNK